MPFLSFIAQKTYHSGESIICRYVAMRRQRNSKTYGDNMDHCRIVIKESQYIHVSQEKCLTRWSLNHNIRRYKNWKKKNNGNTTCSSCFIHSLDFGSSNNSTSFIAHRAPVSLLSKRHKVILWHMLLFFFFFLFLSFLKNLDCYS